jgi:hypothetical protein
MAESQDEQLRSELLGLTFLSYRLSADRFVEALVEVRHRYASTLACLEARLGLLGHTPGTRLTVQAGIAHYRAMAGLPRRAGSAADAGAQARRRGGGRRPCVACPSLCSCS